MKNEIIREKSIKEILDGGNVKKNGANSRGVG